MRSLLLASLLFAAPLLAAEAPPAPELGATVFGVKPVSLRTTYDGKPGELKVGNQLWYGDRLVLQPSGQVKLILNDGSTLKVEGGSDLRLERPQGALGALLKLAKGLVRVVAAKQLVGSRFKVETQNGVVAVKGTQFQVEVLEGKSELKVLEGVVEINAPQSATVTAVGAGESVLSYPDRVDAVRKLTFEEVKKLRSDFKDLVDEQKKAYAKRVREVKGKRTIKQGGK